MTVQQVSFAASQLWLLGGLGFTGVGVAGTGGVVDGPPVPVLGAVPVLPPVDVLGGAGGFGVTGSGSFGCDVLRGGWRRIGGRVVAGVVPRGGWRRIGVRVVAGVREGGRATGTFVFFGGFTAGVRGFGGRGATRVGSVEVVEAGSFTGAAGSVIGDFGARVVVAGESVRMLAHE